MSELDRWYGCYGGSRDGLFTRSSNRHPAKMAVGLAVRILEHGRRQGYWSEGDLLLDPMAGIGTTLVTGAALGYRVVGVELEQHFVELAAENIEQASRKFDPSAGCEIIRGDARELVAALRNPAIIGYSGVLSSPPYADQAVVAGAGMTARILREAKEHGIEAAVKLYRETVIDRQKAHGRWSDENIRSHIEAALATKATGYSAIVTSPPFSTAQSGGGICIEGYASEGHPSDPGLGDRQYKPERHGTSEGQIGNLRDPKGDIDAVVCSPPYSETDTNAFAMQNQGLRFDRLTEEQKHERNLAFSAGRHGYRSRKSLAARTEGQIGCLPDRGDGGETYCAAMLRVYEQMAQVLKAGAVVCLVTKNPVRNGQIRRLDEDTIRLMNAAGFVLIEHIHAMLAEEKGTQLTLDGGEHKIRVERKSFFKRLFEKKYPELRVDHESVLFFRRAKGCSSLEETEEKTNTLGT